MGAYIIRRILVAVGMLLAASLLGYGVMKLTPGDYFDTMRMDPRISQETVERERAARGLDESIPVQYGMWLKRLARLDFGDSFQYQRPVRDLIGYRITNTILLNVASIAIAWLVAVPLGIYAAVHQYSRSDKFLSGLSFLGMSLPGFFVALLLLWIFAGVLNWLPAGGLKSIDHDQMTLIGKIGDYAWHLIIPCFVLAFGSLAGLQRITRGNMLEILRQQYVTTARAKGLPENRVIYRHALRNAINPLITIFGYQFAALFSGAALMEIILSYPGMGTMMYDAIIFKDEPLVMAGFMIGAVMLLVGNLLADILLAFADPRISYS